MSRARFLKAVLEEISHHLTCELDYLVAVVVLVVWIN